MLGVAWLVPERAVKCKQTLLGAGEQCGENRPSPHLLIHLPDLSIPLRLLRLS